MIEYIIVFFLFILAFVGMLAALHFSKYRKRTSGCCGGGHCSTDQDSENVGHSCYDEKVDFVDKYKATNKA
jgi:hypothetical protein